MALRLEAGRGQEEHPPHAHHVGLLQDALQARYPTSSCPRPLPCCSLIGHPTHVARFSLLSPAGQQKSFTPKKYFSIDRVFRNETLDATHLAEFHQIEGLVADYDLTLADLIGVITQFFQKWGNASCVSCVRVSVCVCVV